MINVQPVVSFVKYLQLIIFAAATLYFVKKLFIQFFFKLLIAIIIYTFCNWFKKQGWHKAFAGYFVNTEISEA